MLDVKCQSDSSNVKTNTRHRAYKFSLEVVRFVENFPNKRIAWIITDQLLRSATSIGANLVEAKAASSKKDFIKYYEISLKSANESMYWLCLARDSKIADTGKTEILLKENKEICSMIASSLLKLKGKK